MTIKSFAVGTATLVGRVALTGSLLGVFNVTGSVLQAIGNAGDTMTKAESTPAYLYNLDSKHDYLVEAVKRTGVAFKINPTDCFTEENKDTFGWYWAAKNEMVICQENKSTAGFVSFFTPEDTDTIRHEAQHLIQDCMDGKLNGKLEAVYTSPEKLGKEVLGTSGVAEIKELYSDASAHIQVMEVEAFSVAAMNDPMDQASDIQNFCF